MLDEPRPATAADAPEVLVLQRCCWVTEAIANDRLDIPALHEELADVVAWMPQAWLLRDGGRLVAGVRAEADADTWRIGRLMVAPDRRGTGLGGRMLRHIESVAPEPIARFVLFTGARSAANLAMYERAGYRRMHESDGVMHLEKVRSPDRHGGAVLH